MQALLSMSVSIAGFATPGLIATNVLRTPTEVDLSHDRRELTPWALVASTMSALVLVGVVFCQDEPTPAKMESEDAENPPNRHSYLDEGDLDEQVSLLTGLLRPENRAIGTAARRHTVTTTGIRSLDDVCPEHAATSPDRHSIW